MMKIQIKDGYIDVSRISYISSVKKVLNIVGCTQYYRFFVIVDGYSHDLFYDTEEFAQDGFAKIFSKWMEITN